MIDLSWPWFGDIHALVPVQWAGIISTVAAVICGALIGAERQRAQKPAGMRTLILICLGSAIFTQASILIAGAAVPLDAAAVGPIMNADRGRIAAQVVSGIGFLGAGAIIRERGIIIGVTTGAGIWATAAVGLVLGSGHIAAGAFFTILIVITLAAARGIERILIGPCRHETLRLVFEPGDGKARFQIQSILDKHQHDLDVSFKSPETGLQEVAIHYCNSHREHRAFLPALMAMPGVQQVSSH